MKQPLTEEQKNKPLVYKRFDKKELKQFQRKVVDSIHVQVLQRQIQELREVHKQELKFLMKDYELQLAEKDKEIELACEDKPKKQWIAQIITLQQSVKSVQKELYKAHQENKRLVEKLVKSQIIK